MAEYRTVNKNEEVNYLSKEEIENSNEFYLANKIGKMKRVININVQQCQQQQSSKEDSPDGA